MSIEVNTSSDGARMVISVQGRFDFALHREFRAAFESAGGHVQRFIVNLKNVEYIDSSALGMLLLLREHASKKSAVVHIADARPDVAKVLSIANFEKLFTVE